MGITMGWGDLVWTDNDMIEEATFRLWAENNVEADYVILDLERIRLGTLA